MKICSKMKVTRLYYLLAALAYLGVILLFTLSCSKEEEYQEPKNIQAFVRFNLVLNNNNIPLEYPSKPGNGIAVEEFTKQSIKTLKIPVALSYTNLEKEVEVNFEAETELDESGYTISPAALQFGPEKLVDTISISFQKRWEENDEMILRLTGSSDPEIHLGNLNDSFPNDRLRIKLGSLNTTYTLDSNRLELEGQPGEKVQFKVIFPDGYFPDEIVDEEVFNFLNEFDYNLERLVENENSITYEITLNQALYNDDISYQSLIKLVDSNVYTTSGDTNLLLIKPIVTERDKLVNPAANFYDVTDNFYRTYGENWLDHDNDGICEWRNFFAFTQPIRVEVDDPNAVLYSDNGTADESDDIYYDAFKIGFSSPLEGRTTNPFNLQRWFDNESTDASTSPGFNIAPALEFFPLNGDNPSQGSVQVISQFLTISNRDGVTYQLAISGSGTYFLNEDGIYEIELTLDVENQELFGGRISSEFHIYNSRDYSDLEPLPSNSCIHEIAL